MLRQNSALAHIQKNSQLGKLLKKASSKKKTGLIKSNTLRASKEKSERTVPIALERPLSSARTIERAFWGKDKRRNSSPFMLMSRAFS